MPETATKRPPPLLRVVITTNDVPDIHPDGTRLMRRGDVVEVPRPRGIDLVKRGIASAYSWVRSKEDSLSIGNRIMMRKEEGWCPPDVAERWAEAGRVEVIETAPGYRKPAAE